MAVRANEPGEPGAALWATGNVRMEGTEVVALALDLRPGFEVSGRIQFQADGTHPVTCADGALTSPPRQDPDR